MGERQALGVQDALWLEMDRPNNLMVVDSVAWTAEPLDWDALKAVIVERIVARYPVFQSKAVRDDDGSWWWEFDDGFDPDAHVTRVTLDDPEDPRALQALVASHRTEMLDRDRPLWHVLWVERYRGGSALVLRTHHAIADGMRMVQLSMSMFDASRDGGPVEAPAVTQHAAHPVEPGRPLDERVRAAVASATRQLADATQDLSSRATDAMADPVGRATDSMAALREAAGDLLRRAPELLGDAAELARGALQNPVGAAHTLITAAWAGAGELREAVESSVRHALPGGGPVVDAFSAAPGDVDTVRKLLLGTRNDTTIWTGTAGEDKGVAWSEPLPLGAVKAVARANQCTVNDVLVTCVAGALHDYLADHHARCASVTFMVPVNLKPIDLALPETLGNSFALVQLELPTDQPDLLKVLDTAKRRMSRIKHGHEAAVAFRLQETIAGLNRGLYEASVDLFTNRTLGTLTNVPGPPIPVYLAGKRVEGMVGWAPVSGNQPMSFTIYSYDRKVIVGIACDRDLVPDHESIPEHFARAFHRLEEATAAHAG
jgi:diacylglycerol O-acyltransferase